MFNVTQSEINLLYTNFNLTDEISQFIAYKLNVFHKTVDKYTSSDIKNAYSVINITPTTDNTDFSKDTIFNVRINITPNSYIQGRDFYIKNISFRAFSNKFDISSITPSEIPL
jgi:hypothetical protein